MQNLIRPVDLARAWPFFAGLLVVAVLAFWPTYFAPGLKASGFYIHLHAATASLWLVALITQPWLIRKYRFEVHRVVGKAAALLGPFVLASILLLANNKIRTVPAEAYQPQTYVLYLQLSLGTLFAEAFVLAMIYRRKTEIHARFMVCTGLTLIDPVFARLAFALHPSTVDYHQWITFALTDAVLILLVWLERRDRIARWVFPTMLGIFILTQLPALLGWTNSDAWQAFAKSFQSIPLT